MELNEKFSLVQNLDGTYQLASQPQIRDIKFLNCWKCKTRSVYTGEAKVVKCGECESLNGIPGTQFNPNNDEKAKYLKCRQCAIQLKTYENVLVVKCPGCKILNKVE